MIGLIVLSLLGVTLGGLVTLALQAGHGHVADALGTLLMLVAVDTLGFWLLRALRGR